MSWGCGLTVQKHGKLFPFWGSHNTVSLKRLQFPVRLAFAMTINKSQRQLVEHMGINL